MKVGVKYTILIVCAGLVGAATEASGLFPGSKELLAAASVFIGAVMIFVGNQKTA
jgi:hypothetical protein